MNQHKENYHLLLKKLDRFIRKYYLNALLRGALYFVASILILFLAFNFLEDQFYFSKTVRKFLFYGFILLFFTGLIYWIFRPLSRYFKLGKTLSHEEAALIIGYHFSNIEDKLLNILHLKNQLEESEAKALILAGIEQKSENINPIPFRKAIDLSKNKKYVKYVAAPILLLLLILLTAPSLITDSTERIIQNDKEFEREAPFYFVVKNKKLEVIQYEDFNLDVEIDGEEIPDEVYIQIKQYQYRLHKESPDRFSYSFKNLNQHTEFELFSGKVSSKKYEIEVIPKPGLDQLTIYLDYPDYTGRKSEKLENSGDLFVPVGTIARWELDVSNTQNFSYRFEREKMNNTLKQIEENKYSFKKTLKKDDIYKLYIFGEKIAIPDSFRYSVNVIADKYPVIDVEQFTDSLDDQLLFFAGSASDDYGLSALTFNYSLIGTKGLQKKLITKVLPREFRNTRSIQYDYIFDLNALGLLPGESLLYYFEIFDNDAVNGIKSSRTGIMQYAKPSIAEFEKSEADNEEDIKKDLKKSLEEIKKIKEKIQKSRDKILQKKELEWQDKKELEKLLEQQKELEELIKEAKKKFDENLKNQEKYRNQEEKILKKQDQLQKMFEDVISDEAKELMQKIEELMQELQKDDALEMMEEFEMDNETMEKDLDRLMELFKQLEMEKELTEQIQNLNELAEKQEKLSEDTKKEAGDNEQLNEEQKDINEAFDKLEEKMKELMDKNEKLEQPKDLAKDNEEKMDDISDDLEKSKESLEKNDSDKASESQKSAAQKMKSMASNLEMQMQSGEQEQQGEDLKALRQLLENLLTLSFEQENLVDEVNETDPLTPRYLELVSRQFDLKEDFRMIEDSLHALSKRVVEIESFVNEKVAEIKKDMKSAIKNLEGLETSNRLTKAVELNIGEANKNQRSTMKNINDLALMLNEAMEQMQANMAGAVPGSGSCNKPGGNGSPGKGGKKPSDKISKGQQSLGEQLKGMQQGMKNGKGGMAKEFAQAAARQAALRKAMEEMKQKLQQEGKGAGNELQKIIDEMNKIEIDLVNKRLDNELMKRQQDIVSRLLESEKADKQRKFDNKRKSRTADQIEHKLPPSLEKYLRERESEIDLYKTVSPSLNPYYKNLVDEYYKILKKAN